MHRSHRSVLLAKTALSPTCSQVHQDRTFMPSVAWLQITDGDGNLERLYLSPAHKQAAHKVRYLRTSLRHRIAHSGLSERSDHTRPGSGRVCLLSLQDMSGGVQHFARFVRM